MKIWLQESLIKDKKAIRRPREDISRERKERKEGVEGKEMKEGKEREDRKEGKINLRTEVENLSRELEERDKIIARYINYISGIRQQTGNVICI